MRPLRKTNLQEIREHASLCFNCASCYYHGPLVPHNWLELPPPEWSPPFHKCPSYEYFRFRAYSAVGRGNLASLIFENDQYPISDDLLKIVYTCTSCGMCSEICQLFQPLKTIWALREELVRRGVRLPEPLEKMHVNMEKYNNVFGPEETPGTLDGIPTAGEDIYFAGCNVRFKVPELARAGLRVLQAAGLDIAYLGENEVCCGSLAGHDGHTQLLEDRAVRNIETLIKAGAKRVITVCAGCYKTLKIDYPLIAGPLPFEVVHISELLARLINENKLRFRSAIRKKVTYHDPCFLGRHCKVYDEPRRVLKSIPGIELVEMERNRRWSYCCGGGAKITMSCYPEFATAVTRERLQEGKRVAETIVTGCTSCYSNLSKVAKKEGLDVNVGDISVLVAEAMGINP
jgi:heterodisulfide reductase subunit D